MEDPKVRERMVDAGMFPVTSRSPEEFKDYLAAEAAKWSRIIKETGAKPE
jgi:tripartite-type tricarboxylate transporter receptor subunit TctC